MERYIKWTATVAIVLATLTTAFDITPINKILFLTGSLLWTWVGLKWRQPSLWTLNLFCAVVYIAGLVK